MKQLEIILQRLGLDLEKEYTEEEAQNALFDAISKSNSFASKYIEPKIEEGKNSLETILIGKLQQAAKQTGLELDKEQKDIKTIVANLDSHLKSQYSKGDKDKQEELTRLMNEKRDLELSFEDYKKLTVSEKEQLQKDYEGKLSGVRRDSATYTQFLQIPLTEAARKNAQAFHSTIKQLVESEVDVVEQDGKYLPFKKGTQEPLYKEGSKETLSLMDLYTNKAKELAIYKETEVSGGGDPNRGGQPPKTGSEFEYVERYE